MNISDKIPHGKIGHMCKGGCVGYAEGGVVSDDARDLADITASDVPMAADPEMFQALLDQLQQGRPETHEQGEERNRAELGITPESGASNLANFIPVVGALKKLSDAQDMKTRTSDPGFLRNTVGKALETNYRRGAPGATFGKDAEIPMMAEGGVVDGPVEMPTDEADIPEDVKEYVNEAHIARQESRPDEAWKMVGEKPTGDEIPYKREEDGETPEEPVMDQVPGYAEGGVVDPNDLLGQIAPAGTGTLAPSPAPQPPDQAPIPAPPPIAPMAAPKAPISTGPAPTDADYMAKANKLLGLDANQTASFMKMLGDRSQKAQLGAGLAGIGDAIASGGTLGKVNPGALNKSEDIISNRENAGLTGMQTIRSNQKEAQELGDKLQARDPNSPLSKYAQKAYAAVGKKIGIDLSHASASLIADVTGKGVDALNTELQNQLKLMNIDLQKEQLKALNANRQSEREIATAGRRSEAAGKLANRSTLQTIAGAIPFTTANAAKKELESEMKLGEYGADVTAYAQKHGISPEEAQTIKDKRTKG